MDSISVYNPWLHQLVSQSQIKLSSLADLSSLSPAAAPARGLNKNGSVSNRREKIAEGTLCVVCGDLASGVHYSVASCNGCKTFFRRALVNKQTFSCQFNGECFVGKNVRCVCRCCRLKKCFDSGMDPNAIQHDRDKIRYTKVLKRQREESNNDENGNSPDNSSFAEVPSSSTATSILPEYTLVLPDDKQADYINIVEHLLRIEIDLITVRTAYRFEVHNSATWNVYSESAFMDTEWIRKHSVAFPEMSPAVRCSMTKLREWFNRDLTLMMEWAKLLPPTKEMLLNDKTTLIRNFAKFYPVIMLAYYTKDHTVMTTSDNHIQATGSVNSVMKKPKVYSKPSKADEIIDVVGDGEACLGQTTTIEDVPEITLLDVDDPTSTTVVLDEETPCDPSPVNHILHRLTYPDGTFVDRSGSELPDELYNLMIDSVWNGIRKCGFDAEMFVVWKMMLFFEPNTEKLSETGREIAQAQRERCTEFLFHVCQKKRGPTGGALLFANIIMMSPILQRVGHVVRKVFTLSHYFGHTNDLLDQLIVRGFNKNDAVS